MDKKIFGIRIGTILQLVLCVALAFVIWFIVQYMNTNDEGAKDAASAAITCLRSAFLR